MGRWTAFVCVDESEERAAHQSPFQRWSAFNVDLTLFHCHAENEPPPGAEK